MLKNSSTLKLEAGFEPSAVVLVATVRALKMHGGVAKDDLKEENVEAVKAGIVNLERHVNNIRKFGVEPVIALNAFIHDTDAETEAVKLGLKKITLESL